MSDRTHISAPRRIFIDKQSPKAFHALVQASEAVRATASEAGLDRTTVELINVRVSQLNGCAYCLDVHTRAALRAGESPRRLGVLSAWRDTGLFAPSERAALALAEATTDPVNAATQDIRLRGRPTGSLRGPDLSRDLGGGHHQRVQSRVDHEQAPRTASFTTSRGGPLAPPLRHGEVS